MTKRILIALAIAGGIYAAAVGTGSLLYATSTIATGATHNDCSDYRAEIARAQGIEEHDVAQSDIKAAAIACLEGHTLTEREAFRTEYLFWAFWPGVICAVIFLLWPAWVRILHNQDRAEEPGAA